MTFYTIWPTRDVMGQWNTFHAGQELLVVNIFPDAVRLVMLRHQFSQGLCAYVEGDGAVLLRERGIRRLIVSEVGELSGCCQAREVTP